MKNKSKKATEKYGLVILAIGVGLFLYLYGEYYFFKFYISSFFRQGVSGEFYLLKELDNFREVFFLIANLLLVSQILTFSFLKIFISSYRKNRFSLIYIFVIFVLWFFFFLFRAQDWVSFDSSFIRQHSLKEEKIYSYQDIIKYKKIQYRGGVVLKIEFKKSTLSLNQYFLNNDIEMVEKRIGFDKKE
ncbi:MAG TPA: hypothetical protein PK079_14010 [Leptospiraceae bacterium]|nr:hypothetical protein [Leptospiraceae bacterium]HMX33339.1 hypothetical protein [Leptospiraceae bacterium]HMY34084.1 hypothetical protein [Leptospiraceae bacterium]HMZ64601.1 hypothetical protein [Leptospiraceae bacterium]HNA09080.1 hypothetical protein [Leptospiraceae bacterium]